MKYQLNLLKASALALIFGLSASAAFAENSAHFICELTNNEIQQPSPGKGNEPVADGTSCGANPC